MKKMVIETPPPEKSGGIFVEKYLKKQRNVKMDARYKPKLWRGHYSLPTF
jgi:hypothetical protein